jgi:hypothetical protein
VWALAAFAVVFTLLFTVFLTNPSGLWDGLYESIAYWLRQHGVGRGGEKPYFYVAVLLGEEWPVVLLGALGAVLAFRQPNVLRAFLVWSFALSLAISPKRAPLICVGWIVAFVITIHSVASNSDVMNFYARPIEGLQAIIDLDERRIVKLLDSGVVPIPAANHNFDEASIGASIGLRPELRPIRISQPLGVNFRFDGNFIEWQKWRFHARFENQRIGPILPRELRRLFDGFDEPAAMLGTPEQCCKTRPRVESRPAEPVNRSITRDQRGRLAVANQTVGFQRFAHPFTPAWTVCKLRVTPGGARVTV